MKFWKKRENRTRKENTLLILGLFLSLCLVGLLTNAWTPHPAMTVDRQAQWMGLDKVSIIKRLPVGQENVWIDWVYLSENEDYFMLNDVGMKSFYTGYDSLSCNYFTRNDPDRRDLYFDYQSNDDTVFCVAGFVPEGEEPPNLYCGYITQAEKLGVEPLYKDAAFIGEPTKIDTTAKIRVHGGNCFLVNVTVQKPKMADLFQYKQYEGLEETVPDYILDSILNGIGTAVVELDPETGAFVRVVPDAHD